MNQNTEKRIKRGDVFIADLEPTTGFEQGGTRPIVILQNDKGNEHSPTVIAAPFTTVIKNLEQPSHVYVSGNGCLKIDSMAMLEQVRVLDRSHLMKYLGFLHHRDMNRLDEALRLSLGLDESMELCLCSGCAGAFYSRPKEYRIYRTKPGQRKEDFCMVCHSRLGYDFRIITHRRKGYPINKINHSEVNCNV